MAGTGSSEAPLLVGGGNMIDDISNLLGSREPVNALLGSRRKPQLEVFTVEFGDDAVDVAYYGATVTSCTP